MSRKTNEDLEISEKLIEAFVDKCKEKRSKFFVILLPLQYEINYEGIRPPKLQIFKDFLLKKGIDCLDFFEIFKDSNLFIENDIHPSVGGHELIANSIYAFLLEKKELYLLP